MKKGVRKWLFLFISLLLLIPASFMGIFGTWILESITDNTEVGYIVSFMLWGFLSALPVLIKIGRKDSLGGIKKTIYIVLVGLVFSGMAFSLWNWVFGV